MKNLVILLLLICHMPLMAQGHKGNAESCAPMKKGKVCYSDRVSVEGMTKNELFNVIDKWARKNYGRDVFLSNVASNRTKGSVLIGSKVELLLNETDKTVVKFKMKIYCSDGKYEIEMTDISYQYDPNNEKKFRNYPAESVIANNGKDNTVEQIKDPKLFCNATFFFAENLFGEVFDAVNE